MLDLQLLLFEYGPEALFLAFVAIVVGGVILWLLFRVAVVSLQLNILNQALEGLFSFFLKKGR